MVNQDKHTQARYSLELTKLVPFLQELSEVVNRFCILHQGFAKVASRVLSSRLRTDLDKRATFAKLWLYHPYLPRLLTK